MRCLPFFVHSKKPVGQDQAPAFPESVPKGGLGRDRLADGVDHAAAGLGVLGPEGYQAPAHNLAPALTVVNDRQHRVGGRDIVFGIHYLLLGNKREPALELT